MIKYFKNKGLASTLALAVGFMLLFTPLTAFAAFTQPGIVNGDGVRLRTQPVTGTILGLMYKGDQITLCDSTVDNNYPAWVYIRREYNKTVGWMEWSYFVHG